MKNKLIKFILKRYTDYDKIKDENKNLKSDIKTLIEEPNSIESCVIIESHNMNKRLSNLVWMCPVSVEFNYFDGILNQKK